ncbi:MAG: hypothetical protein NVSMB64_08910 [Candidatus Velthaea sp.]
MRTRQLRIGLAIVILGGCVSLAAQPAAAAPVNSCQGMGTGEPTAAGPDAFMSMCVFATKKTAAALELTTMANDASAQAAYARISRGEVFPGQTKRNASFGKPVGESIAGTPVTFFPDSRPLGRAAGLMYAQKKNVLLQINMMGRPGSDGHTLAAKLLAAALQKI